MRPKREKTLIFFDLSDDFPFYFVELKYNTSKMLI